MPKRPRNIDRNRDNFVPFVDTLKDTEFSKAIESKKAAFVMFYDPRNAKCKEVRQPFVDVAHLAASKKRGFYAVDCLKNKELCDCQCVSSFPTFKLYVNGYFLNNYESAVNVEAMKRFVEKAPIPGECKHKDERSKDDNIFCSLCFAESNEARGSSE